MTKEEKAVVINNLAEQLNEYPHFYLTDIETLNAEQKVLRERDQTRRREEHPFRQGARKGREGGC